jgi:outer membrane protein OmpA-like peptidoglycan-associated protein
MLAITVVGLAVGGSTACATKGYVNTQVGQVSTKVDTLGGSLEETQERTRQNESKITEVDGKAQAAQTTATTAQQAAQAADAKAVEANEAAKMAANRAEEIEKASRRIVSEVVLSESTPGFKFGGINLPDEAKAKIDALITQLIADPKGSYFEIEGHTDDVGTAAVNERIGMERAEAVKRYLYEQHQVPLHRINVISYGETKPEIDNKTRDARAQNRRVVIRVLN